MPTVVRIRLMERPTAPPIFHRAPVGRCTSVPDALSRTSGDGLYEVLTRSGEVLAEFAIEDRQLLYVNRP